MRIALGILATVAMSVTNSVTAQEGYPRFLAELSVGGGILDHETDGSSLDDDTGAGYFRLEFEGFSPAGFGGGIRFDAHASDDDLFVDAAFNATTARTSSLYAHFSYRVEGDAFAMPVRIGLMLQGYSLEEDVSGDEARFVSAGPMFEIAPEFFIVRKDDFAFSLRGTLALGVGGTWIDIDSDANDYTSTTLFCGFEFGPRVYFGHFDCGLLAVVRGHLMDDSDIENSSFVLGYGSAFTGVVFAFGYAH